MDFHNTLIIENQKYELFKEIFTIYEPNRLFQFKMKARDAVNEYILGKKRNQLL